MALLSQLVACGGGNGTSTTGSAAPQASVCTSPTAPAKPATSSTVDVRSFGAQPDDGRDDTQAIQAALNALAPGQWLIFPAGTYQHNARLVVSTVGAVLWSEGATLHATRADDQAVVLAADGASIYNFTLTAVTGERLFAPWHARIAIYGGEGRNTPLSNNVVQGNRVINSGGRGSATANSASAAGIYVDHADNFLIAGNDVRRSLADGIQVTGGSRNGKVLFNTVRETGDDMIGLVSYMAEGDWQVDTASTMATNLAARRERSLVRNILVAHNDLAGNYWGRGISVIGGADITLHNNTISQTAMAAGILIGRESSFVSWGVSNVLALDNTINQVQTTAPVYTPVGWGTSERRTGHGGIEIHSFIFNDEQAYASLVEATAVQNIRVKATRVTDAWATGLRIGTGTGDSQVLAGFDQAGQPLNRTFTGGTVARIELSDLTLTRTATPALQILARTTATDNVFCENISAEGRAVNDGACSGVRPTVTGSALSCAR